jgi:hypothetical protein
LNKESLFESYLQLFNLKINKIILDLESIIGKCDDFEGNCFYINKTFTKSVELINKQVNLYSLGILYRGSLESESQIDVSTCNICEIGFNAGHSSLLLLLDNKSKNISMTIFDINTHTYVNECYRYICNIFPNVKFEFLEGDSTITIPEWISKTKNYEFFDIIHVDGGHQKEVIVNDFANSIKMLKKNGIIIIDDIQKEHINELVNMYISINILEEIPDLFETTLYPHRILKKII